MDPASPSLTLSPAFKATLFPLTLGRNIRHQIGVSPKSGGYSNLRTEEKAALASFVKEVCVGVAGSAGILDFLTDVIESHTRDMVRDRTRLGIVIPVESTKKEKEDEEDRSNINGKKKKKDKSKKSRREKKHSNKRYSPY